MSTRTPASWQIDGDGTLVAYPDPFKHVTPAQAQTAAQYENNIIATKDEIEAHFLSLAYQLDRFDRERHYLARGYESMKTWAESPEIEIAWRTVQDLLRIHREVIPMLADHIADPNDPDHYAAQSMVLKAGISKVRTALPLLRDGKDADFIDIIEAAPQMPWNDVRNEVKDRRGLLRPLGEPFPVLFKGAIRLFDDHATIRIFALDGTTTENLGSLRIKTQWLARFEERFGELISFERT